MKYRKKPVEIDAWQWLYSPNQAEAPLWTQDALSKWPEKGGIAFEPEHPDGARISIATLTGVVSCVPGSWIIKGIEDELYPCKPEIFEATYEKVEK